MALKLEQVKLKKTLILVEEEEPVVETTTGGIAKTQETIEKEIAKKEIYIGKVLINTNPDYKKDDIVCYNKVASDKFDLPVDNYKRLRTINPDYIICKIADE